MGGQNNIFFSFAKMVNIAVDCCAENIMIAFLIVHALH